MIAIVNAALPALPNDVVIARTNESQTGCFDSYSVPVKKYQLAATPANVK
jgi:hypothetical protein